MHCMAFSTCSNYPCMTEKLNTPQKKIEKLNITVGYLELPLIQGSASAETLPLETDHPPMLCSNESEFSCAYLGWPLPIFLDFN